MGSGGWLGGQRVARVRERVWVRVRHGQAQKDLGRKKKSPNFGSEPNSLMPYRNCSQVLFMLCFKET